MFNGTASYHSPDDGIGEPITTSGGSSAPEPTIHSPAPDLTGKGFSRTPNQAEFGDAYGISSPERASLGDLGEAVQFVTGLPSSPSGNIGPTDMADGLKNPLRP